MKASLIKHGLDSLLDETPETCDQDASVAINAAYAVLLDDDMTDGLHLQVTNSTAERHAGVHMWLGSGELPAYEVYMVM
jgi:hypothetical protein